MNIKVENLKLSKPRDVRNLLFFGSRVEDHRYSRPVTNDNTVPVDVLHCLEDERRNLTTSCSSHKRFSRDKLLTTPNVSMAFHRVIMVTFHPD